MATSLPNSCQGPKRPPINHTGSVHVQGLPGAFPASLRSPVRTRSKATACIYPVRGSSSPIPFRDSFVVRIELVSEGPKLKRHCASQASLCWGDLALAGFFEFSTACENGVPGGDAEVCRKAGFVERLAHWGQPLFRRKEGLLPHPSLDQRFIRGQVPGQGLFEIQRRQNWGGAEYCSLCVPFFGILEMPRLEHTRGHV